jgi:hypothetical protein
MRSLIAMMGLAGLLGAASLPARAEIVFLEGGQVASAEAEYAYQHPSLRSVVFVTPETRQLAILPPPMLVVATPQLLWRAPTAMPAYPPVHVAGTVNQPARPSNQDMNNYTLQRSHGFSQELYYRDSALALSTGGQVSPYFYGYGGYGVPYPPAQPAGFNQPARPSNQSMNVYNLERAHRFSMDLYKK